MTKNELTHDRIVEDIRENNSDLTLVVDPVGMRITVGDKFVEYPDSWKEAAISEAQAEAKEDLVLSMNTESIINGSDTESLNITLTPPDS